VTGPRDRTSTPVFAEHDPGDEINPRLRRPRPPPPGVQGISRHGEGDLFRSRFRSCLATQNPIEFEGTYPLPERSWTVQYHISVGYPSDQERSGSSRPPRAPTRRSPRPCFSRVESMKIRTGPRAGA